MKKSELQLGPKRFSGFNTTSSKTTLNIAKNAANSRLALEEILNSQKTEPLSVIPQDKKTPRKPEKGTGRQLGRLRQKSFTVHRI